jgi:hypothetical protein
MYSVLLTAGKAMEPWLLERGASRPVAVELVLDSITILVSYIAYI